MIQNFLQLGTTIARKQALRIFEAGLDAIDTDKLMKEELGYDKKQDILYLKGRTFPLKGYQKVVVVGAGKVAAKVAKALESKLGDRISGGLIIDIVSADTNRIVSRVGTHPLPTSANVSATQEIITALKNLTEKDLVITIIGGGGSSLLTNPESISLDEERDITKALIHSGATIAEMNTVRKHLSSVKGGGLAKYAYPATVISLIFSDIPGDDISQVASGPTVLDHTTVNDAMVVMNRYKILDKCKMEDCNMKETPKEARYFAKVHNILFCSSQQALGAMRAKAHDLGLRVKVWHSAYSGEASSLAEQMLSDLKPDECLIAAGESVVTIKKSDHGSGGRNQEMALAALLKLPPKTTFAALNSDGHDNSDVAGAIVDHTNLTIAKAKGLDLKHYLENHDEYSVLSDLNASIITGLTGSNVSDLVVAIRD